ISHSTHPLYSRRIVSVLLEEPRLLELELLEGSSFLALPLTLLTNPRLLLLHLDHVVGSQFKLLDSNCVVGVTDTDLHGLSEPSDRLARLGEALKRRLESEWLQRPDAVIRFGVVRSEHQLREVTHHGRAGTRGAIDRPA